MTYPTNPVDLTYPATLPIEVAMRTATVPNICKAYGLAREDWDALRRNPTFIADVRAAMEMLRKEGMSFRMKARLQSEELLRTSWKMIHGADTPPAVKADLLKFTMRVAGYDSKDALAVASAPTLNIQINLG